MLYMRTLLAAAVILSTPALPACTDDGPGGWVRKVEIGFNETGYFEARLRYIESATGAIVGVAAATDTEARSHAPLIGPSGQAATTPYDDDAAPYPYNASNRTIGLDGVDKRWWNEWIRMDGGEYSSFRLEYERTTASNHVARGALGSPSAFPIAESWHWCPTGIAAASYESLDIDPQGCTTWFNAVSRGAVDCWEYDENEQPVQLSTSECARFHPKRHWNVLVSDCPTQPNACSLSSALMVVSASDD